jgi:esterase/lipase superfamily enzyme
MGPARRHGVEYCGGLAAVGVTLALAGCATTHPLMPTPALYTGPHAKPLFAAAPADVRTPALDLLYITDRAPGKPGQDPEPYVAERSRSLAFGSTTVLFGAASWDALVAQSLQAERTAPIDLMLGPTHELGRFPRVPYDVTARPDGVSRAPAVLDAHEAARRDLQAEVARRILSSPRKELVLYVHGYHNTFEDAALTMGEMCHFLGREFACGIFTWPAGGKKGILFGYNVDYESSVFATAHLSTAIRAVAATPGLERIHLVAHSRGTDVVAAALSELSAEAYMQQSNLARHFRIGNVVLLAPDIDVDVAPTRIFKVLSDPDLPHGGAPNPGAMIESTPGFRVTIYMSPDDKALAASSWLFGSFVRLGRVDASMVPAEQIGLIGDLGFVDMIQIRGKTDLFGHGYFTSNPRASADLIALLRYGLRPNEPGRPLEEIRRPFWRVPERSDAAPGR